MTIPAADVEYVPDPGLTLDPDTIVRITPPSDPAQLPGANVTAALVALGVGGGHEDIRSVVIEGHAVTVTRFRRSADGYVHAGDDVALTTTTIGVVWP